jgi:hypothetical protein
MYTSAVGPMPNIHLGRSEMYTHAVEAHASIHFGGGGMYTRAGLDHPNFRRPTPTWLRKG